MCDILFFRKIGIRTHSILKNTTQITYLAKEEIPTGDDKAKVIIVPKLQNF